MKRLGLLLLSMVAAGALAATAAATIVVQHSIARVALNMSQSKVKSILGKPARIKRGTDPWGQYATFYYSGIVVTFQGLRSVTSISTSRHSERTASGIGVGSTKAQVRAKIQGVHCTNVACSVGKESPGSVNTTFFLHRGVVNDVAVAIVID